MENKTDKINKLFSKKAIYIMFAILTLVQLGLIIYTFQVKKEGVHSDELWSYGFANSYYDPYLNVTMEDEPQNLEEWVDCDELRDYIVVNEGEQFAYDSVYYNQSWDLSPPLHSMILHTICSFFPETFSLWYSFFINVVAFLVTMIFLLKTCTLLMDEKKALLVCGFYGFTQNCINNFIYLRPYALCTALFMILVYYNVKLVKEGVKAKQLVIMGVVAFLGFMTHMYFILAVGVLTACVCAYLLCKRRIKELFCYGFTMLGALIVMLLAFPNLLEIIAEYVHGAGNASEDHANFNAEIRFKIVLNSMLLRVIYMNIPYIGRGYLKIGVGCLIFLAIVLMPLIIWLRDSAPIMRIRKRVCAFIRKPLSYIRYLMRHTKWIYVIFFVLIITYSLIVSNTSYVAMMGDNVVRYTFFMTPVMVILLYGIWSCILKLVFKKRLVKGAMFFSLCAIIVLNIAEYGTDSSFLFQKFTEGDSIKDAVKDASIIYIEPSDWFIVAMSEELSYGAEYFQVDLLEYEQYEAMYMDRIEAGKEVVLVLNTSFLGNPVTNMGFDDSVIKNMEELEEIEDENLKKYRKVKKYFERLVEDTDMELVSTQYMFGRKMEVYKINP